MEKNGTGKKKRGKVVASKSKWTPKRIKNKVDLGDLEGEKEFYFKQHFTIAFRPLTRKYGLVYWSTILVNFTMLAPLCM